MLQKKLLFLEIAINLWNRLRFESQQCSGRLSFKVQLQEQPQKLIEDPRKSLLKSKFVDRGLTKQFVQSLRSVVMQASFLTFI